VKPGRFNEAKDIAVAKLAVPELRKARMIRNPVLEPQTAEPAVGQVAMHLLAQATFRP